MAKIAKVDVEETQNDTNNGTKYVATVVLDDGRTQQAFSQDTLFHTANKQEAIDHAFKHALKKEIPE